MQVWPIQIFSLMIFTSYSSAQFFFGRTSCLSRCGSVPDLTTRITNRCSCKKSCEIDGDCCQDYWQHCSKSCRGRCGESYHPLNGCQCQEGCEEDCCEDFERRCVLGIDDPLPTTRLPRRVTVPTSSTTPRPIEKGYSYLLRREIECPKGVRFVLCPTNPCEDDPCEKHPDARCLINQCGTCEAKHFDFAGNELDCYDPDKYCPDGQRIFDCGDEDLCSGTSCPGFPRAICVPNKCGGCYYDYVDGKGNIVDCEVASSPSPCGEGIEKMSCYPPPCMGLVCDADLTATCRNVVCGECRAEFYDLRGNVVNCSRTEHPPCEDECRHDPCLVSVCHAYLNAKCTPKKTTRCGDCEASYVHEGRTLRDLDCVVPNTCEEKSSSCEKDPCQMYTCPGRDVICIAQYCDGCNALFFDKKGKRLKQQDCYDIATLDLPICPDGKPADICASDLCFGQRCGDDFSPNCKPDECNNCELMFFDDEGEELNCDDETKAPYVEPPKCENGETPKACSQSSCNNATCQGHPGAMCELDPCDDCKMKFYDDEMQELECFEPEKATSPPRSRGACPSGKPMLDCDKDLCKSADCPAYPNATCRPHPCEGCRLVHFDKMGRSINCDPNFKGDCDGKCGNARNASAGCQCDYGCSNRGDCCSNFREKCETCVGKCGKSTAVASCQCTSDCRQKNNCCSDFMDVCLADEVCEGRCDAPWESGAICQCHPDCVGSQNCCLDYGTACA